MEIAILLYDRFTALDCIGPYEVLHNLPGTDVKFVSLDGGTVRADSGRLAISTDYSIDDVASPAVVLVPGGPGDEAAGADPRICEWLRKVHQTTKWTTSVCTGSIILASAGLLDGLEATTHWASYDRLASRGAKPVARRVVRQGKIITAAGVSAGIDMALELARLEQGDDLAKAVQLGIEYDPAPPFDAGSPAKAPPHVVEFLRAHFAALERGGATGPRAGV
jgi:transcriptional regulator GlxA family with amidase domain